MIDDIQIEIAKRKPMLDLAGKYTQLRRESQDEYHGPCPFCGGNTRFVVRGSNWFCRDCAPVGDHGWHSPIDFIMQKERLAFPDAVRFLAGESYLRAPAAKRMEPVVKAAQPKAQPTDWLEKARAIVTSATEQVERAYPYLESRGIEPATAIAYNLGYRQDTPLPGTWNGKARTVEPVPAVVIPWYRGGRLVAIRYRFLERHNYTDVDGKARTVKQSSLNDSDFTGVLYGGHVLPPFCTMPGNPNGRCAEALRTLVIIEGEINAMSIWQTAHGWKWDVLSLGSESQKLTPGAIDFARRYGRVIAWMDKDVIAKSIMSMIPRCYGLSAPIDDDGSALDANDLLKRGLLAGFLRDLRLNSCESAEERKRVIFDMEEVA
jgi:hypothetical protein